MQGAYTEAANRVNLDASRKNVGGGDIGGMTLTPGVYTFTTAILITKDIILEGGIDDVFIFQNTAVLSQSVNTKVILSGGVQAKNVIWQNAGNVKIQPGAFMQGIILCFTDVAIETGAPVNGVIMAQTAVALQKATVISANGMCPAPAVAEPDIVIAELPATPIVADKIPATPVQLGTAANYAVLSEESISNAATSTITGNIGVSPATSIAITGFGLKLDSSGGFSKASQVSEKVFASDYTGWVSDELTTAIKEMKAAFDDAMSRLITDIQKINVEIGEIGDMTLEPGVYKCTFALIGITINADVTLNGGPDDVFIIQTNGPLTVAGDIEVILTGGVQPKNIFWVVAGDVTVGTDSELQGVILAGKKVLFEGGSTLEGRILAKRGVDLQMAVIGTEDAFCS
jgi:hypothetical protein